MRLLVTIVLIYLSSNGYSQKRLDASEIITAVLKTMEGNTFSMYETKKYKATVFIFLLPDCPACENYTLTLNQLSSQFKNRDIEFFGVFPSFIKMEEIISFRKTYKVNFTLLHDTQNKLNKALDAFVAPEAFVLSQGTVLLYRGRIDDWMYAVGRKKLRATTHELSDALNAVSNNEKVKVTRTKPVGCYIGLN